MTNQASEDIDTGVLLRTQIRKTLHDNEIGFSMVNAGDRTPKQMAEELVEQLAKHYEALIRTEKLKLLAEVRERVVGEDLPPDVATDSNIGYSRQQFAINMGKAGQRKELAKLEAEL